MKSIVRTNGSNNFLPSERLGIYVKIIELSVAYGMTTGQVCEELGISPMTVSRALSKYFSVRSETVITITLQSKINQQESPEE